MSAEASPEGAPWWKSAVVYQIYPRSFCDTDTDGVGDLEGVRSRLDHLAWLGVDAIWLSPFFTSPMADYGYDVADYCDVDPLFGTLDDFDRLVADAHARDIRVLIDWVPNHTSDQHPWFVEAVSSPDSPKRDWYYFRDSPTPGRPPNNWQAAFLGGPAWTWLPHQQQWYLHSFLPQQPDLNWGNPDAVEAMQNTLRFWLDRGVDGFRMDVIHMIGKDPSLPDIAEDDRHRSGFDLHDGATTHELLRGLRQLLDGYDGDRVSVGEVYLLSTSRVVDFYGAGDELHLAFNFLPLYTKWDAGEWRRRVARIDEIYGPRDAWPTWVLSNHDNPRHRTRLGGSEARARAAAVLLLTLPGTPFLYAGEELGLEDAVVTGDAVRDPGGRDGCRAPIPWDGSEGHGWASSAPWLPWPPEPATRNAQSQRADPSAIVHLYRRLLAARRASPALQGAGWADLDGPDGTFVFRRQADGDTRVVIVNFTDRELGVPLDGAWRVDVASDGGGEREAYAGAVAGNGALVLAPSS